MSDGPPVCQHCGYFIDYAIPKAPGRPGWVHSPHSPTKPTGPACDGATPAIIPTWAPQ